jgi:hypothetical protein
MKYIYSSNHGLHPNKMQLGAPGTIKEEEVNRSRVNTCCPEDLPTASTAAIAHVSRARSSRLI